MSSISGEKTVLWREGEPVTTELVDKVCMETMLRSFSNFHRSYGRINSLLLPYATDMMLELAVRI